MRGTDEQQEWMFSYISAEKRVPKDHPLRTIRTMVDVILKDLSPLFESLYAKTGRPSIAPEKLLRTLLLQVLYSCAVSGFLWSSSITTSCTAGLSD